jgi:hypothetical protein
MKLIELIKSEVLWVLVENEETPININDNFWKWFGNSRVVDDNGNPLVVNHGSRSKFTKFEQDKTNSSSNNLSSVGFWFSSTKVLELQKKLKELEKYYHSLLFSDSYQKFKTDIYKFAGKSALDANTGGLGMSLDNPKDIVKKYVAAIKQEGYNGIIIKQTKFDKEYAGGLNDQYIAFEPNQIKSVKNDGTWDINDDNIYS